MLTLFHVLRYQGYNSAADLLDKLGQGRLALDTFLMEVTKIFCATHELEIDLLMQVHDSMSMTKEGTGGAQAAGQTQTTLDFAKFTKILPILGIETDSISAADYYMQCNRSQECFVDWVLNNTSRFDSGMYKPLIQECAICLNALLK